MSDQDLVPSPVEAHDAELGLPAIADVRKRSHAPVEVPL
jgi:hypothetical protein